MAIGVFSRVGLGITNAQLEKLHIGFDASNNLFGTRVGSEIDRDGDGIPDEYELALGTQPSMADSDSDGYTDLDELRAGYDPMASGARTPPADRALINRLKGRIVLQVESRGQAWYINPVDGRRYYLGTPERALAGMRYFGLGITNVNLERIQEGAGSTTQASLVDCGTTDLTDDIALARCFGPRFVACSPARVRTSIDFGSLGGVVGYEYEIVGPQNGLCEVHSRFTSNPNPEFLNKDLICRYDQRKPFNDAVQEVAPSFAACSGTLKPYLAET